MLNRPNLSKMLSTCMPSTDTSIFHSPSYLRVLLTYRLESACQQWGAMFLMNRPSHGKSSPQKRTLSIALLSPSSTGLLCDHYLFTKPLSSLVELGNKKEKEVQKKKFCNM